MSSTFSASSSIAAPWSISSSWGMGNRQSASVSSLGRAQTTPNLHRKLGDLWRDTGDWSPERSFTAAGDSFVGGTVPFWPKGRMLRSKGHIAHDLSWAYWRTRRHEDHPLRVSVGQSHLPKNDVCSDLRDRTKDGFSFWRDLRPPFQVINLTRIPGPAHEGERYTVVYECDVDFHTEHCGTASLQDGGSFDVKIHGEATVLLPDRYPESRGLQILDWGTPKMNWTPKADDQVEDHRPMWTIWQPLAKELNERPTAARFQTIQVPDNLKKKSGAKTSPNVAVDPVSKILLGRHDFAKLHKSLGKRRPIEDKRGKTRPISVSPGGPERDVVQKPRRRHIVFTAAAGFVPYEG